MRKSDLVVLVDLDRTAGGASERVLRQQLRVSHPSAKEDLLVTLCQASFKPAWWARRDEIDYLMVWCDECFGWNQHGITDEEKIVGHITSRSPHCNCNGDGQIYCMGPADVELMKVLRRYRMTMRATRTPPPVRRVYVSPRLACCHCGELISEMTSDGESYGYIHLFGGRVRCSEAGTNAEPNYQTEATLPGKH
jgi:hypothetical protein